MSLDPDLCSWALAGAWDLVRKVISKVRIRKALLRELKLSPMSP